MAIYYEFQIEVTNNEGSIEDPNVFLVIQNGKVLSDYLIPRNFVNDYVNSSFEDDGCIKKGFITKNELHEFAIMKMVITEDEGVVDREYFYLNEHGSLPNGLPQYVQKAFNKCLNLGETNGN